MDDSSWQLLNDYQRDFPLTPRPFARIAEQLGVGEAEVIDELRRLQAEGVVSRVGPVFAPRRLGASTLAAMAVPGPRLEAVAEVVSGYAEVNHNYQREHHYNLWFVATAAEQQQLDKVLADIGRRTGLAVLSLPLVADYHIDLGFRMVPA